jgi:hypothetical protein
MNSNATQVIATSAVRTFTMPADAVKWDRSMFTNTAWLISKTALHPHLYFTSAERPAVLKWCQTSQWASAWLAISNRAFQTITQTWWNTPAARDLYDWPWRIAEIALVYLLTTNSFLLSADPMEAATQFAEYWFSNRFDLQESNEDKLGLMALIYDWLYPHMTGVQRTTVRSAIESTCRYFLHSYWWFGDPAPPDRNYLPPSKISAGSAAMLGSSHPTRAAGAGLMCALAAMGESEFLRALFPYVMNYSIAQFGPYVDDGGPINQGRGYLQGQLGWGRAAPSILASSVFPEARLQSNPRWRGIVEFMMHMEPILFSQVNEPWGDLGKGRPTYWLSYYMRDLALYAQSAEGWRHYLRAIENSDRYIGPPDVRQLLIPYRFPPPGEAAASTVFVNPDGGWAISASKPPNSYDAYTNGVGFITHARPRGSEVNHSEFTDGEVQMWAYGATITDGGVGSYRKHPMYHNCLLVDGIGTWLPQRPLHDWFSRLIAWTNTDAFTYVAMDITRAFNRSNFTIGGYNLNNAAVNFYSTHKVPHVSLVERHIVFPRKKYWVIFDRLQTTSNATFTWKWNVLEPTAVVNTNTVVGANTNSWGFSYSCTNHYNGSNVFVFVGHVSDPGALSVIHLAGTDYARYNPITGEDYGATDGDPNPRWNHTIWVSNSTKTTNWHFLSVVFPRRWDMREPEIQGIPGDNSAVRVKLPRSFDDTIRFRESGTNVIVELVLSDPPEAPQGLAVVPNHGP